MQSTSEVAEIMQQQLSLLMEQVALQRRLLALATEPLQTQDHVNPAGLAKGTGAALAALVAPATQAPELPRAEIEDCAGRLSVGMHHIIGCGTEEPVAKEAAETCKQLGSGLEPAIGVAPMPGAGGARQGRTAGEEERTPPGGAEPHRAGDGGAPGAGAEGVSTAQMPPSSSRWLRLTGLLPPSRDAPLWSQGLHTLYNFWCGSLGGHWVFCFWYLSVAWGVVDVGELVQHMVKILLGHCLPAQIFWSVLRSRYGESGAVRRLLHEVACDDFSWRALERWACGGLAAACIISGLYGCGNIAEHLAGVSWAHATREDGERLFGDDVATMRVAILILVVTPSMFHLLSTWMVGIWTLFLVSTLHCHDLQNYMQQFLAILQQGGEVLTIVRRLHDLEQGVASRLKWSNETLRMPVNILVAVSGAAGLLTLLTLQAAQKYFGQQWGAHLRQKASTWGFRLGGSIVSTRSVAKFGLGTLMAFVLSVLRGAMAM